MSAVTTKSTMLLVTSADFGHLLPMLAVATALRDRGHDVIVHTAPKVEAQVRAAGARLAPYDESKDIRHRVNAAPAAVAANPPPAPPPLPELLPAIAPLRWAYYAGLIPEAARELVADLDRVVAREHPSCVVADSCAFGARYAAERAGVPFVSVSVTPHLSMTDDGKPAFPTKPDLVDRASYPTMRSIVDDAVPLASLRAELGLPPCEDAIPEFWSLMASDLLHVVPCHRDVLPRAPRAGHLLVGPMSFDWEPPGVAAFDDVAPGTVLVTTTTVGRPSILTSQLLEALAPLGRPLLANVPASFERPPSWGSHVRVERYVPHARVLGNAVAVVSHGGWGIVGWALRKATPMLLIPQYGDALAMSKRLADMGLARTLSADGLTADAIRAEVEALLADEAMKERLRAVASELARMDSGVLVAAAIERLVAGDLTHLAPPP